MIYMMGPINGNASAYFAMKEKIRFTDIDRLYILGDVIFGNSSNPRDCIHILDDIMTSDNIELILGDHEYAYIMYEVNVEEDKKKFWCEKIKNCIGGKSFLNFMDRLSEWERKRYLSYLISCEVSQLELIDGRWFYLIHGAPAECVKDDITAWQEAVVRGEMELTKDYYPILANEPTVLFPEKNEEMPIYIVCGHYPAWRTAYKNERTKEDYKLESLDGYQRILFYGDKIFLNTGCQGDSYFEKLTPTLSCIGLDKDGFTAFHETGIFS